jgi:hypothetical protein
MYTTMLNQIRAPALATILAETASPQQPKQNKLVNNIVNNNNVACYLF